MASVQPRLSAREVEVVGLAIQGCSTTEIADLLTVSPDTIKTHLRNVFRKCQVHSRAELTAWWYKKEARSAASATRPAAEASKLPPKYVDQDPLR